VAEALRCELAIKTNVETTQVDVSAGGDVRKLIDFVAEKFGRLDVLVNNASFSSPRLWRPDPSEINDDDWLRALSVDLTGTFYCCKHAIPLMRRTGHGRIINFSSAGAARGDTDTLAYNPGKAGVEGLTRVLARALAPAIQVNTVAPGSIDTGWTTRWQIPESQVATFDAIRSASRRFGTADEVAYLVKFLVSDDAAYITGQTIAIDGGVNI
jgi:NAD(P)-dependent dehydrogenase (short-subunit alcohol dehydrogenase family)